MYRMARYVYTGTTSDMFRVLFREGLLYYRCVGARILLIISSNSAPLIPCSCICSITLTLTMGANTTSRSIRGHVSQYVCLHRHQASAYLTVVHVTPFALKTASLYLPAPPQFHAAVLQFPLCRASRSAPAASPTAYGPVR